ncbi:MAG: UDP-2,3-diacylglucosamine diphosphatase [Candidatus Zixiibacteriota bacterium]
MALYIFSDAHLGCGTCDQERNKLEKIGELFELVKADGDRLVILGDLFDFWFEYRHAIPKLHHRILCMLSALVERGVKIDYVSGNHDFWMGDFFETQIGIKLHRDELDLVYEKVRLHMTHGDGLALADRGYRFLKRVLRNPINIWLYRKLPPDWAIPLARAVSGSSRNYTSSRDHTFAADYEAYAKKKLVEGFDAVVIGHLHIPVEKQLGKGKYINSGDFISHFSYVVLASGELKLKRLSTE